MFEKYREPVISFYETKEYERLLVLPKSPCSANVQIRFRLKGDEIKKTIVRLEFTQILGSFLNGIDLDSKNLVSFRKKAF